MTLRRVFIGLLLFAILFGGAYALLHSGTYGLTVFVLLPIAVGALTAWMTGSTRSAKEAAGAGVLGNLCGLGMLLAIGWEGALCIVMAAPLALPLGALGGVLVYRGQESVDAGRGVTILLLLPSLSLAWDVTAQPPVFPVHTTIEIAATPEQVWKHVVTFSELPAPEEWFFRAGLAYPIRARIKGAGVGAVRTCEFSTGPFVEPIEVWDEPRLLRFRVTSNPAPMRELSFYNQVVPKHLHGYLESKRGQFLLTPLPDGRTRLEGTTWYQHGLWPATYWRWWSDAIIHRIHLRVLTHIRTLAEAEGR